MTEKKEIIDKVPLQVVVDDDTADGAANQVAQPSVENALPGSGIGLCTLRTICAPGEVLNDTYRIVELIGKGGMGEVYRATDLVLGRTVAIKFLTHALSDESVIRFQREGQNLSKLSHPNIAAVYQCGVKDSNPFIVLEYLDGHTLAQIISKEAPLNPYWVANMFMQIADALHAAHSLGIAHRDLKPENIFIVKNSSERDVVKVIDFGIAKDLGAAQELTKPGICMGSPLYMSPEQCKTEPIDHRTDIYSMGCMLFEALAGKPPFEAASVLEMFQKHGVEGVPNLPKRARFLNRIVDKSMSKKPENRYQSMKAFKQALLDTMYHNIMHHHAWAQFGQVRTYQPNAMQTMQIFYSVVGLFIAVAAPIRFFQPPYDKAALLAAIVLMLISMWLLVKMNLATRMKA